jgi:hypothetical protein
VKTKEIYSDNVKIILRILVIKVINTLYIDKFWEELVCVLSLHPYKLSSKSTNWFKSCTHLRSLNVHHFGMVEATALNSMELRSSSMTSPAYHIS